MKKDLGIIFKNQINQIEAFYDAIKENDLLSQQSDFYHVLNV